MKKVSDVKEKAINKKQELIGKYGAEGRSFSLEIGTKRTVLSVYKKGEVRETVHSYGMRGMEAREVIREKSIQIGKFEAILKENLQSNLFVEVNYRLKDDVTLNALNLTEEEIREFLSLLIGYWIDYYEVKKARAVYFMPNLDLPKKNSDLCRSLFADFKLLPYPQYRRLYDIQNFWLIGGKVREEYIDELEMVLNLNQQMEEFKRKEPTFDKVSTDAAITPKLYKISSDSFYYSNEGFRIIPGAKEIKLISELKGERTYQYSQNVVQTMMNEIKEENGLLNLTTPPTRHLNTFLIDKLNEWLGEELLQSIVMRTDGIVGLGNTEEEMVELLECFESKDKAVSCQVKETNYNLYRIKTKRYYWHIITFSGTSTLGAKYKVNCYPTNSEIVPEEIIELIKLMIMKKMEFEKM